MDNQSFVNAKKSLLIAPAGYGKTYTIAECIKYTIGKQLILTHTHAGVSAIKEKLRMLSIDNSKFYVETISSFSQKYVKAFYVGEGIPEQSDVKNYHSFMLEQAKIHFNLKLIQQVFSASYKGLFVDEYQDCTFMQHELISSLAKLVPTHILGDPMQGIFNFNNDLVDFDKDLNSFERFPDLEIPRRWQNTGADLLGEALKKIRSDLVLKQSINLNKYSSEIEFIKINKGDQYNPYSAYNKKIKEIRKLSSVLVLHPISMNRKPRLDFVKIHRDFFLIESIDSKVFYELSKKIDKLSKNLNEKDLLDISIVLFDKTGVNTWFNNKGFKLKKDIKERVQVEEIQNKLEIVNSKNNILDLLNDVKNLNNIKCSQVDIFNNIQKAVKQASIEKTTVYEAMTNLRNLIRRSGRKIIGKCIGTTLLTKGLEFDTVAILNAQDFKCPKNLYVAFTRCKKRLIVFSSKSELSPNKN